MRVELATDEKEVSQSFLTKGDNVLRFLRSLEEAADRNTLAGRVCTLSCGKVHRAVKDGHLWN